MMDGPPYTGPKMEARRASGSAVAEVPRELDEDGFGYGSRWVEVETAGGGTRFQEVPLTREDLFDPQEGDHVVNSNAHGDTLSETKETLRCFFGAQGRADVLLWNEGKMLWKDSSLDKVAPDLSVIFGVKDPKRYRRSFDETREGTRPAFVLEVTSKSTARFDRRDKPGVYRRAKVRECFVLDQLKSPWKLSGKRLNPKTGRYLSVKPDQRGRLLAETLGVCFHVAQSGDELILEDARTGEVLRTPLQESEARRQETEARNAAERRAEQEAEARNAAERRAEQEADARRAAEARVQEILAELNRLKSGGDPPAPP